MIPAAQGQGVVLHQFSIEPLLPPHPHPPCPHPHAPVSPVPPCLHTQARTCAARYLGASSDCSILETGLFKLGDSNAVLKWQLVRV